MASPSNPAEGGNVWIMPIGGEFCDVRVTRLSRFNAVADVPIFISRMTS